MASLPLGVGNSFGFEGAGTISATQRRLFLGRAPFAEDLRLFGTPTSEREYTMPNQGALGSALIPYSA